jgi:hypothetical protein
MSAADSIHDYLDAMTPHVPRHVYHQRFNETLMGEGGFWPTNEWQTYTDRPKWDAAQEITIFAAVQRACQHKGSPAERWAIVERELMQLAHEYGESK